jgi:hypothetical protein
MAEAEWQPDAVARVKLDALKKDFFDYIGKNSEKIDDNVPVFYGHVIATLERIFPEINDELYDRFIDSVTIKVLNVSKRSNDLTFVNKLFDYAVRNKKKKAGTSLFEIMVGLKMISNGKYTEAIEQLKNYRNVDAIICPSIAYCHFSLSTGQPGPAMADDGRALAPNLSILAAREQMIELVRLNPPVNRLAEMDIPENPEITRIFWFMLKQAFDWFPEEREYFRIGLLKAAKDGRREIREEILGIAIERFYNDMFFLRELYKKKLEDRDAGGIAGVIKQMTQQFPDDPEPIYYGLKLSIMTIRLETYYRFRKLAVQKNMPPHALLVLDFAFELMSGKHYEAIACLDEIKLKSGTQDYYTTLLEYVAHDFFSDDEKKVKQAKKAMLDSIDQYCLKLLKVPSS